MGIVDELVGQSITPVVSGCSKLKLLPTPWLVGYSKYTKAKEESDEQRKKEEQRELPAAINLA